MGYLFLRFKDGRGICKINLSQTLMNLQQIGQWLSFILTRQISGLSSINTMTETLLFSGSGSHRHIGFLLLFQEKYRGDKDLKDTL